MITMISCDSPSYAKYNSHRCKCNGCRDAARLYQRNYSARKRKEKCEDTGVETDVYVTIPFDKDPKELTKEQRRIYTNLRSGKMTQCPMCGSITRKRSGFCEKCEVKLIELRGGYDEVVF